MIPRFADSEEWPRRRGGPWWWLVLVPLSLACSTPSGTTSVKPSGGNKATGGGGAGSGAPDGSVSGGQGGSATGGQAGDGGAGGGGPEDGGIDSGNQGILQCSTPALTAVGDVPPKPPPTVGDPAAIITHPPSSARPFFVTAGGAQTALLSGSTEADWLKLVPRQSPRAQGFKCPAGGGTAFTWDPKAPDQIVCGGQTFPNPTDGHTTVPVTVLSGKTVNVPVWDVGGTPSYIEALIDLQKAFFLYDALRKLNGAYVGTKDERYARRIAITLNEWAKYLPDYFLTSINSATPMSVEDATARNFERLQRLGDHNGMATELYPTLADALDVIYDSPSLAQLSTELGYDVKKNIIDNFVMNELGFMLNRVPMSEHTTTNLSGPYVEVAKFATVLGRRDLIEWLDSYMGWTALNLTREGWFPQSFHYGRAYLDENGKVISQMNTFFGVWPPSSAEEMNAESVLSTYGELISRGVISIRAVRLPDGNLPPYGNTGLTFPEPARAASQSGLMPVYGHLSLGDGQGDQQTQVNLGFEDSANHTESDVMSLMLYAYKSELIGEIRDSRMPGRTFTESTFAHNTVAINRATQPQSVNQEPGNVGHFFTSGSLFEFEPNLNGISLAEVDGSRAYVNVASRYQRLLILNAIDSAHPYVIDFFRLKGGTVHDYFLHGAPRFDEVTMPPNLSAPPATSTLALKAMSGTYPLLEGTETWVEPPTDTEPAYGAFRDVWTAHSNGQFDVTFKELAGTRGTRIFMVDDGDTDVYVAKSPNPFRDAPPANTDTLGLYKYWRPSLIVRRRATAALDDAFVSVIEPLNAPSAISKVERVPLASADPDRIALRITFASDREDVVLVSLKNSTATSSADVETIATQDGAFSLHGRAGLFSRNAGVVRAHLVTGDKFDYPGGSLAQDRAAFTGTVTSVLRRAKGCSDNAFAVDTTIPAGDGLHGRWIRLNFGPYDIIPDGTTYPKGIKQQTGFTQFYPIDRVVQRGQDTYVLLMADPALSIENGNALERARPWRTFHGPVKFEIALSKNQ